jgi:hypothetical protein
MSPTRFAFVTAVLFSISLPGCSDMEEALEHASADM